MCWSCPSVCLSVCLSVAQMQKRDFFSKTKQFRADDLVVHGLFEEPITGPLKSKMAEIPRLESRHVGDPIWIKFHRLQRRMKCQQWWWSKSKPEVYIEFQYIADIWANLMACHPRASGVFSVGFISGGSCLSRGVGVISGSEMGRLKMREWKMRHEHNCMGGKCRSGKCGSGNAGAGCRGGKCRSKPAPWIANWE